MSELPKGLIPARYIGRTGFELGSDRTYYNLDGSVRESRDLSYGDCLLMPEREILGQTFVHDPHHHRMPLDLGPGQRVMKEHAGLSREEIDALPHHDYDFQMPRVDFEPVEITEQALTETESPQQKDASSPEVRPDAPGGVLQISKKDEKEAP